MPLLALVSLLTLMALAACGALPATPPPAGDLYQDARIFDATTGLISSAGREVAVEMYEFGRRDLARALADAQRRGARVRVLLDPTVSVSVAIASVLAAGGLPVRFYPVDDKRGQIDHVKVLLADGAALVSGMNWGTGSSRNHDYGLVVRAYDEMTRLRAIFEQDWSLAAGVPLPLGVTVGPIAQTNPGSEIRTLLEGALARARRAISAEVFAFTDQALLSGLCAAVRRGVLVRVLLDPGQDVNLPGFRQLRRCTVAARWYPAPPGAKLHAKIGLFDGLLVLGSANWSGHGLGVNHELDVSTGASGPVAAYAARFARDWEAAA